MLGADNGMTELDLVAEMTEAFEQPIRFVPDPTVDERLLRLNMLQEELNELGAAVSAKYDYSAYPEGEWVHDPDGSYDTVEMVDALVDIEVIHKGNILTFGATVIFDEAFDIVHGSNMAKLVDGKLVRRADGKILKPEGWVAPTAQIKALVEKAMENG